MKRLFFITAMFLASVGAMKADEIVVPNIVIPKGGTAILDIQLNNEQELNRTFGFFINLPEGVTVVDKSEKLGQRFNGTNVSVRGALESDGRYKIMVINGFNVEDDYPIPDNSGTIVTVELSADESIDEGTVLDASIENIELNLFSKETEGTPADVPATVDFQIVIGQPDDGRLKFYETSTTLPEYMPGEKANVTMYRTIKANQWSTICLPFTLKKTDVHRIFGSDVLIYKFKDYEVTYSDDDDVTPDAIKINFYNFSDSLSAKKHFVGGQPYLIKTTRDIESFEADEVVLYNTVTPIKKDDEFGTTGWFRGTLVKTVIPEDGLFINNNVFWYSTGKSNIKAFRCWFDLGAVLDKETTDFEARVSMNFIDGEVSGVNNIFVQSDENVYDLQGRKVTKVTKKGIYIENGKKKIVK